MKPQKRSIRDFFSPVPRASPETQTRTPLQRATADASNAQASQSINPSPSRGLQTSTPSNPSITPTAPITTRATSAETQPPNPSQTSANSGASKRVISNGEQIVLNSDSDDDPLPDLDWGEPITSTTPITTTTRSKRTSEDEDEALRKPRKKEKSGKRSLNMLVKTAQKNMEIEREIIEHKADLDKSLEEPATANITLNEDILGQAVQDDDDDPDKAHRLFLAMQRTNATQMESTFYFFEDTSESVLVQPKFPFSSLSKHRWASSFQDSATRDHAFLSGFAHQVFRLQELPEDLASWMLDQICFGRYEVLDMKYLEILEFHHEHLQALLNRNRLNAIFSATGADVKSLASNTELAPSLEAHSAGKPPIPPSLKSIGNLLQRAAPWLRTKARSHALYLLCHVCLDERVIADAAVLGTIQDAIEAIICNFADNNKLTSGLSEIVPQLLSRITHPILQRNLICAVPTRSPMTAYLQRHLALSFLLHPTLVDAPLSDPIIPTLIHKHLKNSENFRINKNTDYGHLAARLTLLDIAVGPGLPSVPYQPLISPTTSQAGSSPITAPFPVSSEVKEFNKEVDALSQHVKLLGNSIVEAGAVVDLTILDAKDHMERLCSRLEHAVRIGGRKVQNPFGNDDDDDSSKQLRVNKFFMKSRKVSTPTPSRGIFDEEDER